MSNRAWMPLHIADYLADTGHLTATEHGAYLLLIMHYWQNGALPENERVIARIAKLSPEQWEESRDMLAMLFGPGWKHKRIDAELEKADEIIEKRRAAAEARYSKGKNQTSDANAMHVQSKCTDTGVPPSTDNQSSSLRSEDARAPVIDPDFERFWDAYPNKTGRPSAEKAFSQAVKRASLDEILAGVRIYAAKADDRQWCSPVKWLSDDRWKDQPAKPPDKPPPRSGSLSHLQNFQSREDYLAAERKRSERSFR
ncbi:YdaU family protein [Rhizobium sp. 969_B3_N1_2]|uniref:YdaU family protein n=1 Tax=Rhizobium sp. 969_B3_N1_2 TaxID=3276278 RepID=UPI003F21A804